MWTWADLDLGAGTRLRTLTPGDAGLLVAATREETGTALWGPCPVGPYTAAQARCALAGWHPEAGEPTSFGVLRDGRLLAAVGLMPAASMPEEALSGETPLVSAASAPGEAELAYWVPAAERRRGMATLAVTAITAWAHRWAAIRRVWLEIHPDNAASLRVARRAGYTFQQRMPAHCRDRRDPDPTRDTWHDCLIWTHIG